MCLVKSKNAFLASVGFDFYNRAPKTASGKHVIEYFRQST
jgi:hypothetical protein